MITQVWLDTDVLESNVDQMLSGVQQSDAFLLFLTRDYFASSFCQLELRQAWEKRIPIIIVRDQQQGGSDASLCDEIKRAKEGLKEDENKETLLEAMTHVS